ncbi:MAG TPA: hypothetical protein VKB52_02215 [Rhodanobacteraceae bacterium]|nr:hypothetical protein [Rhodanobacteraceae bacterium]
MPVRDAPRPAPAETAPRDDLEKLKDILFGDERGTLEALDGRVDTVERSQRDLATRLPGAIERAQEGAGAERMANALAKPVTHALGAAVRENRQVIIDVLFPVIGPAIRKAIAEALRTLVADVNGAIESSFTPRGLKWRVEAWRSGVPYAQIVLKHTLTYRIDHVFLIERDSGLVLDRESAPDLPDLDADAIAGMLTAIGEFVRDSVGGEGSTLDSARVGEHLLWVVQGPRANLACFIHGVPPARLRALLEQKLEAIHARLAEAGDIDEDARRALQPDVIAREARTAEPAPRSSRWPVRLLLLAILVLLGWLIVRDQQQTAWLDAIRAKLAAHPGFVLNAIDAKGHDAVTVHGLLDPDAEPVDAALRDALGAAKLTLDTTGYVSSDDAIVARRARRLLDAPPGVTIEAGGGVLALRGRAPAAWVDAARQRATWVPGVRDVKFAVAAETDAAAAARAELETLSASIAARRIAFVRETEPVADATSVLDALVADAQRATSLAVTAGVAIDWIATGTNDDPGSDTTNARVRASRAHWLADALGARGIAGVRTAGDDDTEALGTRQRAAFLRLVATPVPK